VLAELDVLQALWTSNVTVQLAQVAQLVETTWAWVKVLMVHLHVHRTVPHLQHVQLATAAMVTVAQELQAAQAVTQSAVTAVSAMTYLAAPELMEHLHVKPQIAALTTTVRSR
jgi:hypothetical protein